MAMANPNVSAEVVEVQEFPDMAQRYQVMGVPKTVINNKVQFVGAVPEATFIEKVLEALDLPPQDREAPSLDVAPELGPTPHPTPSRHLSRLRMSPRLSPQRPWFRLHL